MYGLITKDLLSFRNKKMLSTVECKSHIFKDIKVLPGVTERKKKIVAQYSRLVGYFCEKFDKKRA